MISTPHEYVALLERRGLFSPSAPIPAQKTTVWAVPEAPVVTGRPA
jgi:hypothetical protein